MSGVTLLYIHLLPLLPKLNVFIVNFFYHCDLHITHTVPHSIEVLPCCFCSVEITDNFQTASTIWYSVFRNFYEQILFSIWYSENFHERILFSIRYSVFGNVSRTNNILYSEIFHERILFGIRYSEILHERIYSVFGQIHYSVQL